MAPTANEPKDRRNIAIVVLIVAALVMSGTLTSFVVTDGFGSDPDSSGATRTGSGGELLAGIGGRGAPGPVEPTTFELRSRTLDETVEGDGEGQDDEAYDEPDRYGDHNVRAPAPPPDGGVPGPANPKTPTTTDDFDGAEPDPDPDPDPEPEPQMDTNVVPGRKEPVVVAIIDSQFNPYHYDFLGSKMPWASTADTSDDLPLFDDPSTWVSGYPDPSDFASYVEMDITLAAADSDVPTTMHASDIPVWDSLPVSVDDGTIATGEVHMGWMPGTKVIGFVNFEPRSTDPAVVVDGFSTDSHGSGVTSVAVGNIYGSCPECLLVFVNGDGLADAHMADWLQAQDWIDVVSYSWTYGGAALVVYGANSRTDTESQRLGVERGQQIFYAAGNGVENSFITPHPTLWSSQAGPDWIVTVGGFNEYEESYTGTGKPVDVASLGENYPSSTGSTTVSDGTTFSGTSNATPVTAGLYARALHMLRREMTGVSRIQDDGVISVGAAACGAADTTCATADGELTVDELRNALYRSAQYVAGYMSPGGILGPPVDHPQETLFMNQGHGSFWGRFGGMTTLDQETKRIVDFARGNWYTDQDPAQYDWMVHDSYCRQEIWGTWEHGYWDPASAAPVADEAGWPLRTAIYQEEAGCATTYGNVGHNAPL